MNDWLGIMWLVILLIANAFFVGAEFAVISARRSQVEPLADRGIEVGIGRPCSATTIVTDADNQVVRWLQA